MTPHERAEKVCGEWFAGWVGGPFTAGDRDEMIRLIERGIAEHRSDLLDLLSQRVRQLEAVRASATKRWSSRDCAEAAVMSWHAANCWAYDPVQHTKLIDALATQIETAVSERLALLDAGHAKADAMMLKGMELLAESRDELKHRCRDLEAAIRKHRDQRADDRCWMDDLKLYELLGGDGGPDNRVGDKFEMMKNCIRYIDARCQGGIWKSYVELEAEIAEKDRLIAAQAERIAHQSELLSRAAEREAAN